MAALSNQELTQQLQALQSGMQVVEMTLESIVPSMDASIQESKNLAEELKRQLTTHVDPIVKADVIGTLTKVDQNHQLLATALDGEILEVHEAVQKMNKQIINAKSVSDQSIAQIMTQTQRIDAQIVQINALNQESTAEKTSNDVKYASTQSQIETMHATSTGSSTGPGRKLNEPMVCHKVMLGKTSLSGEEDYDLFDE